MKNREIDKKTAKQALIDIGLHKLIKIEATKAGISIKELVETALINYLKEIAK